MKKVVNLEDGAAVDFATLMETCYGKQGTKERKKAEAKLNKIAKELKKKTEKP